MCCGLGGEARKAHHCPAEMQVPPMDVPGHGAGSLSSQICFCWWGWGYIFYVVFGEQSSDCKFSDLLACRFPGPLLKRVAFSTCACWCFQTAGFSSTQYGIHIASKQKPKKTRVLITVSFWRFKYSNWFVFPPSFPIFLIFFVCFCLMHRVLKLYLEGKIGERTFTPSFQKQDDFNFIINIFLFTLNLENRVT